MNELIVRPDKNEFLLYSMLNALGLARGNPDSHHLRRKTVDHFHGYEGLGLTKEEYRHHSKPVSYVLTLNEAPNFSEKQGLELEPAMQDDVSKGRVVLPHMVHFYQNTDFERFYGEVLPGYEEECEFLQGVLDRAKIRELLDNVWEVERPFDMVVIPMPLEASRAGIGPSIGDTDYSIVGPSFDYGTTSTVAHEGSHPRAKRILQPIMNQIVGKKHLLEVARTQPNWPDSYEYWSTCFEEHFIRAMQAGYIDPVIDDVSNSSVDQRLGWEERGSGMAFIRDFYDELRKYKEGQKREDGLQGVALRILNRLDNKYK